MANHFRIAVSPEQGGFTMYARRLWRGQKAPALVLTMFKVSAHTYTCDTEAVEPLLVALAKTFQLPRERLSVEPVDEADVRKNKLHTNSVANQSLETARYWLEIAYNSETNKAQRAPEERAKLLVAINDIRKALMIGPLESAEERGEERQAQGDANRGDDQ
jgi:hypothetical protein